MLEATGRHLSSSDEALPTTPQGAIIINQPSSNDMPSLCQTDFITHGKQASKHYKKFYYSEAINHHVLIYVLYG